MLRLKGRELARVCVPSMCCGTGGNPGRMREETETTEENNAKDGGKGSPQGHGSVLYSCRTRQKKGEKKTR